MIFIKQKNRFLVSIILVCILFGSGCKNDTEVSSETPVETSYDYVISVISGNYQHAQNGESLDQPIVISVTDNDLIPQSNIPVQFEIICGGGSLAAAAMNTDASGHAESNWILGNETDHILKISISDSSLAARAIYMFANTNLEFNLQWISGLPFRIESERVAHDDKILESSNFLTFSDASSDDTKVIYMKMAEEAFGEIKQAFGIQSSEELGIISSLRETKITIFTNKEQSHAQMAFPLGFYLIGLDSDYFSSWWNGNQVLLRQWYRREVKHETMHVLQWLLGLDWEPGLSWNDKWGETWPEFWFSEGISEYISGGAFEPIENMDQVSLWFQDPDHVTPVGIIRSDDSPVTDSRIGEYYPMFGLAVRYLMEAEGQGKTFSDVKEMYLDMIDTRSFRLSFEKYMGMSVGYYQENFLDLLTEFFNNIESVL